MITCCYKCPRRKLHCRDDCPDWAKQEKITLQRRQERAAAAAGRYTTYDSDAVNRSTRSKDRKGAKNWRWR